MSLFLGDKLRDLSRGNASSHERLDHNVTIAFDSLGCLDKYWHLGRRYFVYNDGQGTGLSLLGCSILV